MRTEHACRPTRRYTGGGRPEHAHQARDPQGHQLSLVFVLSHTHAPIPMSLYIVFCNAQCMAEVNARHPNAVDQHIREFQWQHWCRDKCRSAALHASFPNSITLGSSHSHSRSLIMCPSQISHPTCRVHSYSPLHHHIIIRIIWYFGLRLHRWRELVTAIRYCNGRAQYML